MIAAAVTFVSPDKLRSSMGTSFCRRPPKTLQVDTTNGQTECNLPDVAEQAWLQAAQRSWLKARARWFHRASLVDIGRRKSCDRGCSNICKSGHAEKQHGDQLPLKAAEEPSWWDTTNGQTECNLPDVAEQAWLQAAQRSWLKATEQGGSTEQAGCNDSEYKHWSLNACESGHNRGDSGKSHPRESETRSDSILDQK